MRSVGIKAAKATLPALLREVEAGNEILLTRHGRPVAKLVPVEKADDGLTPGQRGWGMFKGQMHLADDAEDDEELLAEMFGIPPRADPE
jgi:prevent-host-death family protein